LQGLGHSICFSATSMHCIISLFWMKSVELLPWPGKKGLKLVAIEVNFLARLQIFIWVKVHGASCVVLVINENSYGLLLSFGFSCRTCP
jgi:hypothetical protein